MKQTITQLAYSLADLAEALGVSVGFLRLEIARGRLNGTYLGRRVVITKAEADRYLMVNTTVSEKTNASRPGDRTHQ